MNIEQITKIKPEVLASVASKLELFSKENPGKTIAACCSALALYLGYKSSPHRLEK